MRPAILNLFLGPQVMACGKGAAVARNYDPTAVVVRNGCGHGVVDLLQHLVALGVELVRAIENDAGDLAWTIEDVFKLHGLLLSATGNGFD